MRQISSILIGGVVLAWMAYLSWPVTADLPARQPSVVAPVSKSKPTVVPEMEVFEYTQPKTVEPSA